MGFFSRIKKFWGADAEPREADLPVQTPAHAPEAERKSDHSELEGQPEETPARSGPTVQSAPAPTMQTHSGSADEKKDGGWRKLFGLGGKTEENTPAPEPALQAELLFQEKPVAGDGLEPWQKSL